MEELQLRIRFLLGQLLKKFLMILLWIGPLVLCLVQASTDPRRGSLVSRLLRDVWLGVWRCCCGCGCGRRCLWLDATAGRFCLLCCQCPHSRCVVMLSTENRCQTRKGLVEWNHKLYFCDWEVSSNYAVQSSVQMWAVCCRMWCAFIVLNNCRRVMRFNCFPTHHFVTILVQVVVIGRDIIEMLMISSF